MNPNEFALLFTVVVPAATLAAMNAHLWYEGEVGTLLLPAPSRYPAFDVPTVDTTPASTASGCATEPAANEDFERDAA